MKSPPVQYTDDEARRMVEEFIVENQAEKETSLVKKKERLVGHSTTRGSSK
jgi:hypothetical protein